MRDARAAVVHDQEHKSFAINLIERSSSFADPCLHTVASIIIRSAAAMWAVNNRGAFPNRSGTRRNWPTLQLTVRPNGADRQWKEDPSM